MPDHTICPRWLITVVAIIALFTVICLPLFAFAQTSVTLTWTANTETDLAGYEFHRAFIDCKTPNAATLLQPHIKVGKVTTFTETVPAGTKVVCYGLKAFDTSNNFSELSNLAGKVLPVVPTLLGHWDKKTDVPVDPKYNLKTYTIHALVYPKAPLVAFSPVLVKNYTYMLYATSVNHCGVGGILALHRNATGDSKVCLPTPLPEAAWTALTATYDGTTLTIYRNKVVAGSIAARIPADSTEALQIAGSKFNETCNCELEVWLYEGAMTAAEVAALPQAPTPAVINVTPTVLAFSSQFGQADPPSQLISVANVGAGTLTWAASTNQPWLTVTPSSGSGPQSLTVAATMTGLTPGTYLGQVTITATNAQPVTVAVTLTVAPDVVPPNAPSNFILSSRPTADSAVIAWQQSGGMPSEYRVDFFRSTAWVEDHRITGAVLQTSVRLPEIGRRIYRVCAIDQGLQLCPRDGVWINR